MRSPGCCLACWGTTKVCATNPSVPACRDWNIRNTPDRHAQNFMNQAILDKIESEQFRKNPMDFGVGDTVRVHTKVVEGDKERIQIFTGVVIGKRGRGLNEMFTVRRISYGEGVERVFPVHSPRVD